MNEEKTVNALMLLWKYNIMMRREVPAVADNE